MKKNSLEKQSCEGKVTPSTRTPYTYTQEHQRAVGDTDLTTASEDRACSLMYKCITNDYIKNTSFHPRFPPDRKAALSGGAPMHLPGPPAPALASGTCSSPRFGVSQASRLTDMQYITLPEALRDTRFIKITPMTSTAFL